MLVKKYGNRRLYDTHASRYVTLEEIAAHIRGGGSVTVVDVKSGSDLTQATLAQIILDGRGAAKLLPIALLTQLIRLEDDTLVEFFGQYVSWALEAYLQAKRSMQVPPFAAANPFAPEVFNRWFSGTPWPGGTPHFAASRPPETRERDEVADLRRELEELKRAVNHGRRTSRKKRS